MARLPVMNAMRPCPCLSPCQFPSRDAVTSLKISMSLLSGANGAVVGPSWKLDSVPPAGGKNRSRTVPHGLWTMSNRVGGPAAAAASSGRRNIVASPAPMPPPTKVRRRMAGEWFFMSGAFPLVKAFVARHEAGRGRDGLEQIHEGLAPRELISNVLQ